VHDTAGFSENTSNNWTPRGDRQQTASDKATRQSSNNARAASMPRSLHRVAAAGRRAWTQLRLSRMRTGNALSKRLLGKFARKSRRQEQRLLLVAAAGWVGSSRGAVAAAAAAPISDAACFTNQCKAGPNTPLQQALRDDGGAPLTCMR
jgi:hypothetical protein